MRKKVRYNVILHFVAVHLTHDDRWSCVYAYRVIKIIINDVGRYNEGITTKNNNIHAKVRISRYYCLVDQNNII